MKIRNIRNITEHYHHLYITSKKVKLSPFIHITYAYLLLRNYLLLYIAIDFQL